MKSMISRIKGKHSHLPPVVENRDVEDFLSPETCVVVTVLSGNKQLNIFIIMVEDKSMHVTTTSSSKMWSPPGAGKTGRAWQLLWPRDLLVGSLGSLLER